MKFSIRRISKHELSIAKIGLAGVLIPVGTYAANPFKAWQYAMQDMSAIGWTLPQDKKNTPFVVQVCQFSKDGFVSGDVILERIKSFCFLNIAAAYDRYSKDWQELNQSDEWPSLVIESR